MTRSLQSLADFFGDALDVAAGGSRLVHVIGGGELAGEQGILLGGEDGVAVAV